MVCKNCSQPLRRDTPGIQYGVRRTDANLNDDFEVQDSEIEVYVTCPICQTLNTTILKSGLEAEL